MTKSTPSSLGVKHQRLGQQTDALQWTPRQAMSEPFAHMAQCHLSEETSPSRGNSPFPPKSLLQSNSVFPLLGLLEMGHWWWSTLSVGTTWRWLTTPAPVVAPVCRHTLHEARTKRLWPLHSSLTGPSAEAGPPALPPLLLQGFDRAERSQLRVTRWKLPVKRHASFWRSQ